MARYLCMAKHLFPSIGDDEWREGSLPIDADFELGAAIDFVRKWPDEAGVEPLNFNEGEHLYILVKCVDTGAISEIDVVIKPTYSIVSASVISDRRGREINAPV